MSCMNFVSCNSQLPVSWIFFAAFSLRLLSLCDSVACTSRPCNSSFDQLRLSDRIGSKSHICNFDLGFPRIAPNVEAFTTKNLSECYFWSFEAQVVLRRILVFTFIDNFYDAFFLAQTGSWWWRRRCLPKFVLASQRSEFSTLHFVQIFNEFDKSPSSVSWDL